MKHIEYEERVLISALDYQKIINDLHNSKRKIYISEIENIYLDNKENEIYKSKKMLRVRTINKKDNELTLKIKKKDGSCIEINETIKHHPLIDKELNNQFQNYQEIARLNTHRIEVKIDDYLLVVDKNEYCGITDFDIEIEANSQQRALKIIKHYCDLYNLKYDSNYKSKSHRAIEEALKKKMK